MARGKFVLTVWLDNDFSKHHKPNIPGWVLFYYQVIGLMGRVFANGLEDWSSIPGWVIPKTQRMVLDAAFPSTQFYKVRIKGKVEQSWEWSSTPPRQLGVVAIEKRTFQVTLDWSRLVAPDRVQSMGQIELFDI